MSTSMQHVLVVVIFGALVLGTDMVASEQFMCYNCTLVEMGSYHTGQIGCKKDAFDVTGIATVPCTGKCAVSSTDDPSYPITNRGCQPGDQCIDISQEREDYTFTQKCCTGNLCNGDSGISPPQPVNPDLVGYEGLVCYSCSHVESGNIAVGAVGCKKPFNDTGIDKIPCSGKCSVTTMDGSLPSTMRDCKPAEECVEFSQKNDDTTVTQKCCTNNLCNDAGVVTYSLPIAIAAVIMAVVF